MTTALSRPVSQLWGEEGYDEYLVMIRQCRQRLRLIMGIFGCSGSG
jgi:hypothetical protein